jgi:hypothetical protein
MAIMAIDWIAASSGQEKKLSEYILTGQYNYILTQFHCQDMKIMMRISPLQFKDLVFHAAGRQIWFNGRGTDSCRT